MSKPYISREDLIAYCIGQIVKKAQMRVYSAPIYRQPNEILRPILAELDMQELIGLRAVCRRWKDVIESIGYTKKSLILSYGLDGGHVEGLNRRFFRELNLDRDFVYVKLMTSKGDIRDLASLLLDIFPKVEQLLLKCSPTTGFDLHFLLTLWPSKQITTLSLTAQLKDVTNRQLFHFAQCINSFSSLSQLDLCGNFQFILKRLSPELFARLGHFSYAGPCQSLEFVRHLGPACSRLYLSGSNYSLTSDEVEKWLNPELISGITHLSLPIRTNDERFWLFICDKFVSLRTLQIHDYYYQNHLTPQLMSLLSLRPSLTNMQLYGFFVYFDHWSQEELERLVPLATVQTCTLRLKGRHDISLNINRLIVILSTIFPNCLKLDFEQESQFCIQ